MDPTSRRNPSGHEPFEAQPFEAQPSDRQPFEQRSGEQRSGEHRSGEHEPAQGAPGRRPSARRSKTALVTGASRGLGLALAEGLAAEGWRLVIDARERRALRSAAERLAERTTIRAIPGDVADGAHREALIAAAWELGGLDALVLNAGVLGPSPMPALADYPIGELERVYRVNVVAQLALVQAALPLLPPGGRVVAVTSDAARVAYPGWGGYGSAKAALEQLAAVLAAERPDLLVYSADPGDMRTRMHAEAFPGEDISDRPLPEVSVPGLLRLLDGNLPSGRYEVRSLDAAMAVSRV